MDTPVFIVAGGVILVGVGTTAFLAGLGPGHGGQRVGQQVRKFQRFHQVGIPNQAAVGDFQITFLSRDGGHLFDALFEGLVRAENGGVFLHGLLHLEPQIGGGCAAVGVTQPVETVEGLIDGRLVRGRDRRVAVHHVTGADRGGAAKDHEVNQGV